MTLRIVLSVAEILLLVVVLAYFVIRLTQSLSHIGDTLEKISEGVQAIEGHCSILGPGTEQLNGRLTETAGGLERATAAARQLANR